MPKTPLVGFFRAKCQASRLLMRRGFQASRTTTWDRQRAHLRQGYGGSTEALRAKVERFVATKVVESFR